MKVAIQMITIATTVSWVLLIVFAVTVVYSMKDIRINWGEPESTVTANEKLLLEFPIEIVNDGYYSLQNFNISTQIYDSQGSAMARGTTFLSSIGTGQNLNTTHQIMANLTDILQKHQDLMFNDRELQRTTIISMKTAELISFQTASNSTFSWGAPLYNLTIGPPRFTMEVGINNTNYYRATLPVSFENHALFNLSGTAQVNIFNYKDDLVASEETLFNVAKQSSYKSEIQLDIQTLNFTSKGHAEISFSGPFFSYGPLVIPYG